MAIVTINQLSIAFRGPPLLDSVTCKMEPDRRIGLLGRNGSGKTTLLRIVAGQVEPDDEIHFVESLVHPKWIRRQAVLCPLADGVSQLADPANGISEPRRSDL